MSKDATEEDKIDEDTLLEELVFDTDFFYERESVGEEYDRRDSVAFRLKPKRRIQGNGKMRNLERQQLDVPNEVFLILYNRQNGYYSHGFNLNVGGEAVREGSI